MNENHIEIGDTVNVYFERFETVVNCEVLYIPQDVGDSWRLKQIPYGKVFYVQIFSIMKLIQKKEK